MIHSVKILDEKSLLNKHWGPREFKFSDGVNVIFGKNGCGKSILMTTISLYVGIDGRGWSCGLAPSRYSGFMDDYKDKSYLGIINKDSKLGRIDINWDGVPCYKSDTQREASSILSNLMQGGQTEEVSLGESIGLMSGKLSAGQSVQNFLGRLLALKIPDITKPIKQTSNEAWASAGRLLSDYVSTLPRNGKPTILLDEPDKSLDFQSQYILWHRLLDELSKTYQVIVITHSPFALGKEGYNIIDKEDYYNVSKSLLKDILVY